MTGVVGADAAPQARFDLGCRFHDLPRVPNVIDLVDRLVLAGDLFASSSSADHFPHNCPQRCRLPGSRFLWSVRRRCAAGCVILINRRPSADRKSCYHIEISHSIAGAFRRLMTENHALIMTLRQHTPNAKKRRTRPPFGKPCLVVIYDHASIIYL